MEKKPFNIQSLLHHPVSMVIVAMLLIWLSSFLSVRIDLTAEKRFSLTPASKTILQNLDTTIQVDVLLDGSLSADYKKLRNAVVDILNEFRSVSGGLVEVNIGIDLPNKQDSAVALIYDSLASIGVVFERTSVTVAAQTPLADQYILPSAVVRYGNRPPVVVDLRSSRKVYKQYNVLSEMPEEDVEATRAAAEALLEYKFISAIDQLTRKDVPTIAYVVGNGQPLDDRVEDLGQTLSASYRLAIMDLKQAQPNPDQVQLLLVVKPTEPFSETDLWKLDQYVMRGGKIIWCIDPLYAEYDSLRKSTGSYVAFDRNLQLDDLLFRYGARINKNLAQDLNCAKIPIVIGYNPDGSPQMQRVPWAYYPFLFGNDEHPTSRNLERVLSIFPSSIDTVKAPGIQKTILLTTDTSSRVVSQPALIDVNSVKTEEDFRTFRSSRVPVAVLLEGKFRSLYANRMTPELESDLRAVTGANFLQEGVAPAQQLVVADADLVTNAVTQTQGPLAMGTLPMEQYRFANREFIENMVTYMLSEQPILEARNKEVVLRLLDKQKLSEQKSFWQLFNIIVPILLMSLIGFIMISWRKKQFAA